MKCKVEKNNITFSLREEHKESVLSAIKKVTVKKTNLVRDI